MGSVQKRRTLHGRGFKRLKRLTASSLAASSMNKRPKRSLPRSLHRQTRRRSKNKRPGVRILGTGANRWPPHFFSLLYYLPPDSVSQIQSSHERYLGCESLPV